jgi:hypothetical protein
MARHMGHGSGHEAMEDGSGHAGMDHGSSSPGDRLLFWLAVAAFAWLAGGVSVPLFAG